MGRLIVGVVVALSLWSVISGRAGEELKHSGRLAQIGPDGQVVTLEEMVTWTGPGSGLTEHSVAISTATRVRLIRRAGGANTNGWLGGFTVAPLSRSELRVGDWVTVEAEREGDRLVAASVEVVRP
jgi:hypothetical protein